jgi:hypothetical protein
MMQVMTAPEGFARRTVWAVQMFVLPLLVVFFLCPCGSIYNPNAPHGKRELSAVADVVGTVAVLPVVPVIVVGVQASQLKYKTGRPSGMQKAAELAAPVVLPPFIIKEEIAMLKAATPSQDAGESENAKAEKAAAPKPRSRGTHPKQGGI